MKKQTLKLSDLKPDPRNARKHSTRNLQVIEKSLERYGAGRSVLLDENHQIIAGHGVIQAAASAGIQKVRTIEADGKEIIAVVRRGLTKKQKMELAIADNRASDLSEFDADVLAGVAKDCDLSAFFRSSELAEITAGASTESNPCPEMEIQPFEHYDYIVLFFKNSMDFLQVCERLGIKKVQCVVGEAKNKKTKIGLGRCLDAAKFAKQWLK